MTPGELLRKVQRLEIRTRKLVNQSLAGSYHSVFRGRGMEFAEVREYQAGDDVRSIDWNVSARMQQPFVKKFTEERQLTVVVAVDTSASGRFGTARSTKQELATEVSALLAFSAIRNNDRVGLLLFSDRIEHFVPPRKGREHALRVLRDLVASSPQGAGTDIAGAVTYLRNVLKKRAVVFLVSDFQDRSYDTVLRTVARKHDVVGIRVSDPRESELPSTGLVAVADPETGERRILDAGSRRVRSEYASWAERRELEIRETVRKSGIEMLELDTGEDYEKHLVRFFRTRARRAEAGGF